MHRVCLFIVLVLHIAFAPRGVASCCAEPLKLDFNEVYPLDSVQARGALEFARLTREHTRGGVVITVRADAQMGYAGPELLSTVRDGRLAMSGVLMGHAAISEDVFALSSFPMLANSFSQARQLYAVALPAYQEACEAWRQKLLYALPWPPSGLCANHAVNSLQDFVGLKPRTYDKVGARFLELLGARPMALPWSGVKPAIERGLIDSVLTSGLSCVDGEFWKSFSHFTDLQIAYTLSMAVINLDVWNGLAPNQKQGMLRAANETQAGIWRQIQRNCDESLFILQGHGMNVTRVSDGLREALREKANELLREFSAKASPRLGRVLETVGEVRSRGASPSKP